MTSLSVSLPDHFCRVQMTRDERWVSLTLSLEPADARGRFFTVRDEASCQLTGLDDLSREYRLKNWQGGIISGARYAFRLLSVQPRCVCLHELRGQLGSDDVAVVANGAALAVARLCGRDELPLQLEDWKMESELWRPTNPANLSNGGEPERQGSAAPPSIQPTTPGDPV